MSLSLADRMRALAELRADVRVEFNDLADQLDAAITGGADGVDVPKIVGTWARARRRWCEVTGEPLV